MISQRMIKGLIIDNCKSDIKHLTNTLSTLDPNLSIDYVINPSLGLQRIKSKKFDVIFLDMEMPDLNGIKFLSELNQPEIPVIIVSSFPEFAIESTQFRPFDYLLKPVSVVKLGYALSRVKKFINDRKLNRLFRFQTGKSQFTQCAVDDIYYIEATGDYQKVYTTGDYFLTISTMDDLTEQMKPLGFLRSHRSFLINTRMIMKIFSNSILVDNKKIPIGRTFKQQFRKYFN